MDISVNSEIIHFSRTEVRVMALGLCCSVFSSPFCGVHMPQCLDLCQCFYLMPNIPLQITAFIRILLALLATQTKPGNKGIKN